MYLWNFSPKGTISVKFGIYMRQTTIFRGVLNNCPYYFLSPYYCLISNIYILKPPYTNYNILFQIITNLTHTHTHTHTIIMFANEDAQKNIYAIISCNKFMFS
jgi:hypothetical protein